MVPFLVLTLFSLLSTTCFASLVDDFRALVSLKQGFEFPEPVLNSWDLSNPSSVCSWVGIHCSRGRVSSLDLTGFNLYGSVSPQISKLDQLASVSLAGNNFSGAIELVGLSKLRFLNISNNQFNGGLDWNYTSTADLEVFDAFDNNFTAFLPLGILNLKKLRHLELGGNYFYGRIPASYGKLAGLEYLSLMGNDLHGKIPGELGNLTSLREIYLGNFNVFEGEIPVELSNLVNLVHMDLSSCGLDGPIPNELGNLKLLHTLYLHINLLSGSIPKELGNFTNLVNLDLSYNALTGEIPFEFINLKQLNLLNLFLNRLHGSIPDYVADLPNLETLQLWNNNFTGVIPRNLGRNGKLQILDLSSNKLTGTIPQDLCSSNQLRVLILFKNFLFGPIPEGLGACYSLTKVRLGQNYLNGSIPSGFIYLPELNLAEFQSNYLSGTLSENGNSSSKPVKLGQLDLSNNLFSGPLPSSLSNFSSLQTLLLSGNKFSGPIPPMIGELQVLKLDLSRNSFSGPIPPEIGNCFYLTFLDISQNNLSGPIPSDMSNIHNLNYLNLSRNHLNQTIPKSLGSLKSLTIADFSFNDFAGKLPESGQFSLFNASSFAGNPLLCGPLLNNPCNFTTVTDTPGKAPSNFKLIFALGLLICSLIFATAALIKAKTFKKSSSDSWKLTTFQQKMAPGSSRRNARSRTSSSTEANDGGDNSLGNAKPRRRDRNKDQNTIRILNVDIKILLGISVLAFFVILLLIRNLIIRPAGKAQRPRFITPFPSPKLMDLPQFQGEHRESLYWGTYRPHVYFGIRARTPRSLVAGLMWIGVKDGMYHMRHVCQDSDELNTYGWTQHNGRDFGHQVLVDQGLKLTTSFLKSKSEGSGYGGDWAVQIDVQTDKPELDNEMLRHGHLFFYLADESGHVLSLAGDNLDTDKNSLLALGSRSDIGDWQLHLKSKEVLELHYSGFRTPHIHNLSDLVQHNLGAQVRKFGQLLLSDSSEDSPNILVFQISANIPFKADIAFVSGTKVKTSKVKERVSRLTGASLTSLLRDMQTEFDVKFERCFNVADKLEPDSTIVGKAAIANMLGGIGYFYGQSKISIPENSSLRGHDNFISYWPAELYTAVPSRPFFPRGFLWDEGFHQLLIWRWDVHICLDIIGHWLDLMNMDGWIPREQILGSEALSKVPEEFVAQYPSNGNPPTLFLVIRDLLDGIEKNKFTATESNEITSFLERAFVRLEAWFQWYNTTQKGKEMGSYYWHGRDNKVTRELNPKTLSSGLDDYPRASHPSDEERHVDLRCWMLLAANCMQSITQLLKNDNKPEKEYGSTAKLLSDFDMLNQMHLHPLVGAYYDFGNHTEKVRLSWKETRVGTRELVRDVLERPVPRFVPHIGYVSLFPFMGKIIPSDSWILGKQLDLISNSTVFWTDYGLRSLSKTSSMYMKRNTEHDPPYWRGPIWMNMNYMILSALYHYSKEDGPYSDRARVIYDDLRGNLIRNVVRNYHQTGFLWEQYDQKKGKGKGARLFTGWTSLVLLIMAEAYT